MIIPEYWAEARVQHRQAKKQITIRRFGWSDASQTEAQDNAEQRAQNALQRAIAGEKLIRREPKKGYNGADGVPIREEIIGRHGNTVITRNSYGARCLNTPNALFADIDFRNAPSLRLWQIVFTVLLVSAFFMLWSSESVAYFIGAVFVAMLASHFVSAAIERFMHGELGKDENIARKKLAAFAAKNPAWGLRIYRTPAGLRVLVTHKTFNPSEPDVSAFFAAIKADPLYVKMCLHQQCFRARVSPKPWRIGIAKHMKPAPGVWPIAAEKMPQRTAWVQDYEARSKAFAACCYTNSIGAPLIHPHIQATLHLHDEMCGAETDKPIA